MQSHHSQEIKSSLIKAAILIPALLFGAPAGIADAAELVFPGKGWERVNPADHGWSLSELENARAYARELESAAVLIVQDGRVIADWGDSRRKLEIHSVRKSFMSALYGVATAQRKVDLNATLADLKIDDKPPRLTPREKQATVRDLLMARSGIYHEAAYETRSMKDKRPDRGSHAPGTFWFYNNWDFNALGTILRNATGEDTFTAMERQIARPLQMQDFNASDGRYVYHRSSEHPAYTMQFSARDLARFGWLYLNRGNWNGRQVIPAEWVAESTKVLSHEARTGVGYGYLWWIAERNKQFKADTGPGSFSARGAGGQYIVVSPARRTVVVHLNDNDENGKLGSRDFAEVLERIFAAAPR